MTKQFKEGQFYLVQNLKECAAYPQRPVLSIIAECLRVQRTTIIFRDYLVLEGSECEGRWDVDPIDLREVWEIKEISESQDPEYFL